jgi:hypothetical protein
MTPPTGRRHERKEVQNTVDWTVGPGDRHRGAIAVRSHTAPVDTQERPLTKSAAWDHDWTDTSVIIGAQLAGVSGSRET